MNRTAVLNIVGLTQRCLGANTPRLQRFAQDGRVATIVPAFPALTCTAQSNYLTGVQPAQHGIVGNGWHDRELAEVQFWKQSDHLVGHRKLWEELAAAGGGRCEEGKGFTCAKLFWWFNMYSRADYSITPRPMYPADGRKVFDIYTAPASIRDEIKAELGEFPFATFWGPAAGVASPQGGPDAASRWIAASAKWIEAKYRPTLNLVYLPHLDYNLQRLGPNHPAIRDDLGRIDAIAGDLIDFLHGRGVQVLVVSEYGITEVNQAIHLNRLLREKGWIAVRDELGLELLDCGASRVFAVADHQAAHIYLNDPSLEKAVRSVVEAQRGVAAVWNRLEQQRWGIDHPRAGDLVAVAREDAWFTYYYWLDDARAPDFARTVDIHRKPGYDPVELFVDPRLRFPRLRVARRLLQKKLGFRMLMDVVPLEAALVKGSHGARPAARLDWPVLMAEGSVGLTAAELDSTAVYDVVKRAVAG